ncbi:MAG TPA: LysM peptidoglycan-binding domain-containing protein [Verrucomicrobiae bacterium]
MIFSRTLVHGLAVAALVAVTGCFPPSAGSADEQKDPYYLSGKRRVNNLDFNGALEDFEKALEANPRSASAHLELGILHEQRTKDYSAAIYHLERFLKFKPDSDFAEPVRQRIVTCKQELARTVSLGPVNQMVQRDLERLDVMTRENLQLKTQLEQVQNQMSQVLAMKMGQQELQQQLQQKAAASQNPSPALHPGAGKARPGQATNFIAQAGLNQPAVGRTHTIQSGDTLYKIARQYKVSENALKTANPGVDPRRMKLGQVLKIPTL